MWGGGGGGGGGVGIRENNEKLKEPTILDYHVMNDVKSLSLGQ